MWSNWVSTGWAASARMSSPTRWKPLTLIDTHQHLIYRDRLGYGWTSDIPALAEGDFTLGDYGKLTAGRGVGATIFMETGVDDADYQAEARFVSGLIGQGGMLGQIASCRPETGAGFDTWLAECAGLGVVGFRRILHVMPDELSQSALFRSNLRKIGAMGLPFDLCVLARQLPLATDLARDCAGVQLVLDHCGVPDIAGGQFDDWARDLRTIAACANVAVKLSGISAYCAPGTVSTKTLRPWVEHVIDCFGPGRIVWGGDWPVVNLGAGLPRWIEMTEELIADLPGADQDAIRAANARRIYGV